MRTTIEKQDLIDMYREDIFPSQARHLLKLNYEGQGEQDMQEYLRDTAILLDLAEKGLDYDTRLNADMVAMLEEISLKMDKVSFTRSNDYGVYARTPAEIRKDYSDIIQEKIKAIEGNEDGK